MPATGNGIQSGSNTAPADDGCMPPEFGRLESTPGRSHSGGLTSTSLPRAPRRRIRAPAPPGRSSPARTAPTCCASDELVDERLEPHQHHRRRRRRPAGRLDTGSTRGSDPATHDGDQHERRAEQQVAAVGLHGERGRDHGRDRGCVVPGGERPQRHQGEQERQHRHDRLPHLVPGLAAQRPQEPRRDRHHDARPDVAEQPSRAPRHRDERGDVDHRDADRDPGAVREQAHGYGKQVEQQRPGMVHDAGPDLGDRRHRADQRDADAEHIAGARLGDRVVVERDVTVQDAHEQRRPRRRRRTRRRATPRVGRGRAVPAIDVSVTATVSRGRRRAC